MYKDWLSIQNRIQHVSTGISFFLNSVLICLICIYSPKKIGTYKYLMIYISVFQMFYSIMDTISLPVYHTVSSVFVVFKDIHEEDYIPVTLHYWLLVVYTGCYGFCMAIFGIHFFYRFLAVYGHVTLLKTFENFYLVFWLLVPPTFGFIWAMTSGIFFAPTPETSREIQQSIQESYELEMNEIVYIAAFIWPKNEATGKKYLNMTPATGIAIDQVVVVTSLSAIFYFGSRCYYKILDTMKIVITISRLTQNLHRQLFYALVMQTAIPIMLLHLPVSGLFMFPIMDSELGFFTGFVTITIAMYPAIDPLPTMFVIENYRKAVFGFFATVFCCRKGPNAVEPSSFAEGQISMSTMTN